MVCAKLDFFSWGRLKAGSFLPFSMPPSPLPLPVPTLIVQSVRLGDVCLDGNVASFAEGAPNVSDPAIGAIASTHAHNSRQACIIFKQARLKLNHRRIILLSTNNAIKNQDVKKKQQARGEGGSEKTKKFCWNIILVRICSATCHGATPRRAKKWSIVAEKLKSWRHTTRRHDTAALLMTRE